ncbi:MAG: HEAT repeat domain-containing protein [Planctomycetes bacterium]|nr:HEAT repeat domain-containing protein [Planctomycetota bacterium]MCH9724410.1 HEAT repeat domain-containing protein [Planctomycetota bacterium]MCH9776231.1 HEAT repeat domain-containing protein [Planctomycetota bacterium]MCH9793223.1 HEAT repeat domain-containing protein [Planctomycetota bacterium]
MNRLWFLLLCFVFGVVGVLAPSQAAEEFSGLKVPEGFRATLYADDELAHDIYSMTIDSLGRVVVSGPGYVRILIDADQDGVAESYQQFADGPKTGAQGMYFLGRDLLCTGDAGLIRYRDQNADDRADGKPDVFLQTKTGGEHNTHSIQKGPDGWWYLLLGNTAGINEKYITRKTSPVKKPYAGTLMRLSPDLTQGEVIADGFRNAYDFSFSPNGDVFTYDSDGERDISLPWYRPTRVFHVLPGSNAGWRSRSWKRPDLFFDMPPVIAAFHRGSPTGVTSYQHRQFPTAYQGALFVADWTFGRVHAIPLEDYESTYSSEPSEFITGVGQFGFAPTDLEIGLDGSLYVSVGGRGTRGSVFRIEYTGPVEAQKPDLNAPSLSQKENDSTETLQTLTDCLSAPQPLSSWSRQVWLPQVKSLETADFFRASLDRTRPVAQRIRAIEIITEVLGGFPDRIAEQLILEKSDEVRARLAWSLGYQSQSEEVAEWLNALLKDESPLVARFALQAFLQQGDQIDQTKCLSGLQKTLGARQRYVRQSAARAAATLKPEDFKTLSSRVSADEGAAQISLAYASILKQEGVVPLAVRTGISVFEGDYQTDLRLDALRLIQLGLGDLGPPTKMAAVFDGYANSADLAEFERHLDPIRIRLMEAFPSSHEILDYELARVLSMLTPYNPKLLDRILAKITKDSDPVSDLHYLIVAARIPSDRSREQSKKIASALVHIDAKLLQLKLPQDTNWDDRFKELYTQLVKIDADLPRQIVEQPDFGMPGHVLFLSQLPSQFLPKAIEAFDQKIKADPDFLWNSDVVFVFGESKAPEHREMIRNLYDDFALQAAVLAVLGTTPEEQDREKFIAGLASSQIEMLEICVSALEKLSASTKPEEKVRLFGTLRRLGTDKREQKLKSRIGVLLRKWTGQQLGLPGDGGDSKTQRDLIQAWEDWLSKAHPKVFASILKQSGPETEKFFELLETVDWEQGDKARGEALFRKRACVQCHGNRSALGPALTGAAKRFSRKDLFTAIVSPNRDVSPRYQTTVVETVDGKVYTGLVVYRSVDGLTLRNSNNQTTRIEADEIDFQSKKSTSLMPKGLLKDLSAQDLADLNAYLQGL